MKLRALAIATALVLPTVASAQSSPSGDKAPPTLPSDKSADKSNDKANDTSNDKSMDRPADKTGDKTGDKNAKLSDGDTKIIAHLHHVNMMEIDAGKIAQKNGSAAVKSYAATLISDHQSNDKDLTSFAKQHKLAAIPADKPQADADKQDEKDMAATMAHLKTLKGSEFDKAFLNMMVSGHDKELAKIDSSIGSAGDADLKSMLTSVKPVLQRHSDQAKDLQKSPQASADKTPETPDKPDKTIDKLPSQR
jgi:putative membrane protein